MKKRLFEEDVKNLLFFSGGSTNVNSYCKVVEFIDYRYQFAVKIQGSCGIIHNQLNLCSKRNSNSNKRERKSDN